MHHFSGHCPGKHGLASWPRDSKSPVILILSILTGQTRILHIYMVLTLGCNPLTYISRNTKGFCSRSYHRHNASTKYMCLLEFTTKIGAVTIGMLCNVEVPWSGLVIWRLSAQIISLHVESSLLKPHGWQSIQREQTSHGRGMGWLLSAENLQ